MAQVPPGVVRQILRPAVHLPLSAHLESLMVDQEHAARPLALSVAQRHHVDAFRPAMHGVRPRVAGLVGDLLGLDHLDDLGLLGVRLGIEDMDARGAQARHHQVAPLRVRVRCVGAQARGAGVPAEVVQLVALVGHLHVADDLGVGLRLGIDVDHGDRVGFLAVGIEGRDVGERLGRGLHRHAWRGVKARIGCPGSHGAFSALLPAGFSFLTLPAVHVSSTRPLAPAHDGSEVHWPVFAPFQRVAAPLRRALAVARNRAFVDALVDGRLAGRHEADAPIAE